MRCCHLSPPLSRSLPLPLPLSLLVLLTKITLVCSANNCNYSTRSSSLAQALRTDGEGDDDNYRFRCQQQGRMDHGAGQSPTEQARAQVTPNMRQMTLVSLLYTLLLSSPSMLVMFFQRLDFVINASFSGTAFGCVCVAPCVCVCVVYTFCCVFCPRPDTQLCARISSSASLFPHFFFLFVVIFAN